VPRSSGKRACLRSKRTTINLRPPSHRPFTICQRCACRSKELIKCNLCRPRDCRGSSHFLAGTASSSRCRTLSFIPSSPAAHCWFSPDGSRRSGTIIGTQRPGKIHHELRRGELAHFKLIPHTPYYGTADATPLYLITLHSAWMCTGDRTLLTNHLNTAERCLDWIDQYGDRDGDGFQEYQTRSPVGYENQGWKDSGDAVMNVD
jgi:hypothetical protein